MMEKSAIGPKELINIYTDGLYMVAGIKQSRDLEAFEDYLPCADSNAANTATLILVCSLGGGGERVCKWVCATHRSPPLQPGSVAV